MSSFKVRRKILAKGGIQVGSNGTNLNQAFWGSACINCASVVGDARTTGSVAIPNIADGDKVVVTVAASLEAGMILYSACGVDGGIAASFMNSGSAAVSTSADVAINYIVFN